MNILKYSKTQFDKLDAHLQRIADAQGTVNGAVDSAVNLANQAATNAEAKIAEVETRFTTLTTQQQLDAEVIDARNGETSLKTRLDRDNMGVVGRRVKIVACVLRCDEFGNWNIINDSMHGSINVDSVSQDSQYIHVSYTGLQAKKVITFIAAPDEAWAGKYSFGASVGTATASIMCRENPVSDKSPNISGFVFYDGSSWQVANNTGNLSVINYDPVTGLLKLSHDSIGNTVVHVNSRDAKHIVGGGWVGDSESWVYIRNYDGTPAPLDATVRLYFSRERTFVMPTNKLVNPANMGSEGNIWCFGMFEI